MSKSPTANPLPNDVIQQEQQVLLQDLCNKASAPSAPAPPKTLKEEFEEMNFAPSSTIQLYLKKEILACMRAGDPGCIIYSPTLKSLIATRIIGWLNTQGLTSRTWSCTEEDGHKKLIKHITNDKTKTDVYYILVNWFSPNLYFEKGSLHYRLPVIRLPENLK